MARSVKWGAWGVLVLTAALASGCDPATYMDQNFGTTLGADFMETTRDAGDDTTDATTPEGNAGAGGVAGAGAAGGTAGSGS
jgi:hypothetical protein